METLKKRIRLGVVHSSTGHGLSIRPLTEDGELSTVHSLRTNLIKAGYNAGDEVILISPEELDLLSPPSIS